MNTLITGKIRRQLFIAMLVIIFVVMLLFSLIGQVISFIESLYNEIMLRV
jgi:hypothetical protein